MRHIAIVGLAIALAAAAQARQAPAKAAFVLPSKIEAHEPFTFGLTHVVEGEVVTIKTVEGEVVSTQKPRSDGTIFLPAGLALGGYVISSGKSRPPVTCSVGPPSGAPIGVLSLVNPPQGINLVDGAKLAGSGFCPDASQMVFELGDVRAPVLAATKGELVTGPLAGMPTGPCDLYVGNTQTSQGTICKDVLAYRLTSQLVKRRLVGGEQTMLEFRLEPAEATAQVRAQITSGPVTFSEGQTECLVDIVNGLGSATIISKPGGQGPFTIGWEEGKGVIFKDEKKPDPKEKARQQHVDAAQNAEKEAKKAEKAAEDAESKGDHDKAASERERAANKYKEEAEHLRAAGDREGAAHAERDAAKNSRKEAENHDKKGKSQSPGKEARGEAAEAEKRAAQDEQRHTAGELKEDAKNTYINAKSDVEKKAADAMDRVADGYERAAKDYRANGEGAKAREMDKAAQGARSEAERLRKK